MQADTADGMHIRNTKDPCFKENAFPRKPALSLARALVWDLFRRCWIDTSRASSQKSITKEMSFLKNDCHSTGLDRLLKILSIRRINLFDVSFVFFFGLNPDALVKSRHSGENRSPEGL